MAAGIIVTKSVLDLQLGALVNQGINWMESVRRMKAWLDTKTDQDLIDLGYVQGDVDLMKSAYTDLNNLRLLATAQRTQATENDFFFFGRQLAGTGV